MSVALYCFILHSLFNFVPVNSNNFKPIYWRTYYFVGLMYIDFMSNKIYVFIYLFIYSGFNNNRYIYTDIYVNQYIKYMDIEKGLSVQKLIMIGLPVRAKSVPKILSIIYIILNSKICNSSSHVLWFYWKKTNTSWDRFCDNLLSTWVS